MGDTPGSNGLAGGVGTEPTLEEQIAAYQREFQDLDPQVEKIVSALSRLNRRMNVAYGRQTSALGISNAEWEVLKALVLSGAPYRLGPSDLAKRLGLTPAAVSHQVKEIEDQLDLVLFTRTSRTMRLTEAGNVLHEASIDALDLLNRAVSRAHKMTRGTALLKVTLDAQFATKWLMRRIDDFRGQRPGIELRFDITYDVRDFERDDVDIGIRFGTGRYAGL